MEKNCGGKLLMKNNINANKNNTQYNKQFSTVKKHYIQTKSISSGGTRNGIV